MKMGLLNNIKQGMIGTKKSEDSNVIFVHKSFDERLKEYDGDIEVYEFEWGEPVGREMV